MANAENPVSQGAGTTPGAVPETHSAESYQRFSLRSIIDHLPKLPEKARGPVLVGLLALGGTLGSNMIAHSVNAETGASQTPPIAQHDAEVQKTPGAPVEDTGNGAESTAEEPGPSVTPSVTSTVDGSHVTGQESSAYLPWTTTGENRPNPVATASSSAEPTVDSTATTTATLPILTPTATTTSTVPSTITPSPTARVEATPTSRIPETIPVGRGTPVSQFRDMGAYWWDGANLPGLVDGQAPYDGTVQNGGYNWIHTDSAKGVTKNSLQLDQQKGLESQEPVRTQYIVSPENGYSTVVTDAGSNTVSIGIDESFIEGIPDTEEDIKYKGDVSFKAPDGQLTIYGGNSTNLSVYGFDLRPGAQQGTMEVSFVHGNYRNFPGNLVFESATTQAGGIYDFKFRMSPDRTSIKLLSNDGAGNYEVIYTYRFSSQEIFPNGPWFTGGQRVVNATSEIEHISVDYHPSDAFNIDKLPDVNQLGSGLSATTGQQFAFFSPKMIDVSKVVITGEAARPNLIDNGGFDLLTWYPQGEKTIKIPKRIYRVIENAYLYGSDFEVPLNFASLPDWFSRGDVDAQLELLQQLAPDKAMAFSFYGVDGRFGVGPRVISGSSSNFMFMVEQIRKVNSHYNQDERWTRKGNIAFQDEGQTNDLPSEDQKELRPVVLFFTNMATLSDSVIGDAINLKDPKYGLHIPSLVVSTSSFASKEEMIDKLRQLKQAGYEISLRNVRSGGRLSLQEIGDACREVGGCKVINIPGYDESDPIYVDSSMHLVRSPEVYSDTIEAFRNP